MFLAANFPSLQSGGSQEHIWLITNNIRFFVWAIADLFGTIWVAALRSGSVVGLDQRG